MSTTPTTSSTTGTDWSKTPPAMGTARVPDGQKTLGKDSFLKLLVTELQYQDPLKPMENRDFIAQMAQFSALEQMQNMNGDMAKLLTMQLLGKSVNGKDADSQEVTGTVAGIKFESDGTINLTIKTTGKDGKTEDKQVALSDVSAVNPAPEGAA